MTFSMNTKWRDLRRSVPYVGLTLAFFGSFTLLVGYLDGQVTYQLLSAYVRRALDALLWAIPVFFLVRKRTLFPYLVLAGLYELSNLWYYRYYGTMMPMTSYLLVDNLENLGPSIRNALKWTDVWIVLPLIAYMGYYAAWGQKLLTGGIRKNGKYAGIFLLLIVGGTAIPDVKLYRSTGSFPYDDFRGAEVVPAFKKLGFINYWRYQMNYLKGCTAEEEACARDFMEQANKNAVPEALVAEHRKNLILIVVESLQSWPVRLQINGVEVTPHLNALINEPHALYFDKVLPQVKGGRSSDAQLLLNTGLLPIANGAVACLYADNEYPSLAKALREKGYTAINLVCEDRAVWNQGKMSEKYGFNHFVDRMEHGNPLVRADENLFKYGLQILKSQAMPFYAQLVTFSGHDAVDIDFESKLRQEDFKSEVVKKNLIVTQYVDHCIGTFIDSLKQCGLYEKSIVVITGDHDFVTYNLYEGRRTCQLSDRYVPWIVLNAPLKTDCTKVLGQMDIYPSLLDMMGVEDYYFRGLGESVFRPRRDCAVYHTGAHVGNCRCDLVINRKRNLWKLSDIMLRMDYFGTSSHP